LLDERLDAQGMKYLKVNHFSGIRMSKFSHT